MPDPTSTVIKRAPGLDEYLYYSSVVDHPTTYVMTRAEMREFLVSEHRSDSDPERLADDRLTRADANGTSAMYPTYDARADGGWEDDLFLMRECDLLGPGDHTMNREQMFEHMKMEAGVLIGGDAK